MTAIYTAGIRVFVERAHVGDPERALQALAGSLQKWGSITTTRQQPYWKTPTLVELRVDVAVEARAWKNTLHEVLAALGSGWTTNENDIEASATCDVLGPGVLSVPHARWANVEIFPTTAKH